jgi:16S rRNA (uracil1498-N3)-methyltransferase
MDRFFVERALEARPGAEVRLSERESRHARVKRLEVGDRVRLFDAEGVEVVGEVARLERSGEVVVVVEREAIRGAAPAVPVTLGVVMPKGKRAQALLEKATELGVAAIFPLVTARSVGAARSVKEEKWRATTIEAAKQSGVWKPPEVGEAMDFGDAIAKNDSELRIILHPGEGSRPLREVLMRPQPRSASVLVGPEGGFTEEEVEQARAAGWERARLGKTILRIETAAIAAVAGVVVAYEG